jgi:hypothetical protein
MLQARVDPSHVTSPEIEKICNDLLEIQQRFASLHFEPIAKGTQDVRAISWRCRAIASANLLRGEELLRFGILALNEGAMITAYVIARALDETLAAIVGSKRLIETAVAACDEKRLERTLNKLTCGSRYMAQVRAEVPKPYDVGRLVGETAEFLDGLVPPGNAPGEFGRNYGFVCEFVHPSIGSFSIYQKFEGSQVVFERVLGQRGESVEALLSNLRMSGHLILTEAQELAEMADLKPDWPKKSA